jgi:hypothetical protein
MPRLYEGGVSPSSIGDELGFTLSSSEWRKLTDRGLKLWGHRSVTRNGTNQRLLALARQGGFPVAAIETDGWAARYLEKIIGQLLAVPDVSLDVAIELAETEKYFIPESWQCEEFFTLSADLAIAIVLLRKEAEHAAATEGLTLSCWLEIHRPDWRESLPIIIDSATSGRLLDGLMKAAPLKATSGSIHSTRLLHNTGNGWQPMLRLYLSGIMAPRDLNNLSVDYGRLRAFAAGKLAQYIGGELAVLESPSLNETAWVVRALHRGVPELPAPFDVAAEIELRTEGKTIARVLMPNGAAICVIGDLFQLPPVVSREEKTFYAQYYPSPFFFCTKAYAEAKFTTVQFGTIHRQNDRAFIEILNAIRAGTCDEKELATLNNRLSPKATPAAGTLVVTTTNALAEDINHTKLAKLPGTVRMYEGIISGDFGMKGGRLPAPEELALKVGAQVMFVKNDSDGRWVNGTIGIVQKLGSDSITVSIGDITYEVKPEKWKTIGYEFSEEQGKIVEKTLGAYTQFPITLAWAITIHKSQGKTLERVIIDLGTGAFAAGQLYVALSRCKSLSGIALKQSIAHADIRCDAEVVEFMRKTENQ